MIPPVLAGAFAKPLIKYGVMAGAAVLLVGSIWGHGYFTGKESVQEEWDASIAQAAAHAVHESVKADAMESAVVKVNEQDKRVIAVKKEQIERKVVHHARKNPKPLSDATVAIYNELVSLPNEAGRNLPSADPGARAPEIPRGGLAAQTVAGLQDENGQAVELTTEELAQAAVDFAEKYALMKNAYKGLSDWNDGRERLELERLSHD